MISELACDAVALFFLSVYSKEKNRGRENFFAAQIFSRPIFSPTGNIQKNKATSSQAISEPL